MWRIYPRFHLYFACSCFFFLVALLFRCKCDAFFHIASRLLCAQISMNWEEIAKAYVCTWVVDVLLLKMCFEYESLNRFFPSVMHCTRRCYSSKSNGITHIYYKIIASFDAFAIASVTSASRCTLGRARFNTIHHDQTTHEKFNWHRKKQNPNTVRTFYFDWFNFIIVRTVHSFICYIWLIHISLTFPFQQVKKYFSLALFSLFICTQIGIVCIRLFLFYFVKFLLIVFFFVNSFFIVCVCVLYFVL